MRGAIHIFRNFLVAHPWIVLTILLVPPVFGYVVWIRLSTIAEEYRILIQLNETLIAQMDRSKDNQWRMTSILDELGEQQARFVTLLERLANLEQRNQSLAQQQLAALTHMVRTQEVNAYVLTLPPDKRPQLPPPSGLSKWLQDTQGTDDY